jgi:PrtD family type I secretion system ABC transporter
MTNADNPAAHGPTPVGALLRLCRHSFVLAFAFTFVIQLLALTPILYMLSIYDRVIAARSGVTLVSLTVLILGVYLFWSGLDWLRSRLLVRISLRLDWDLAGKVFDASFRRSVGRRNVNVSQLLGDLVALRQFFTGQPLLALLDAPFALMFIIVGALFHPWLAVFIAVASLLMLASAYATQKISGPIMKAANDENAEAARIAVASLRQAEATLALGMMGPIRRRWHARHRQFLQYSVNASEASGLVGGLSKFLSKSLPSLTIALGAWLAIEGQITGGMVIAASMLISRSVAPIQKVLANWKDIVSARQAYDRINLLLAEDAGRGTQMQLPPPTGSLHVSGAAAVAPGGTRQLVCDVSFTAEPGEVVVVVGPSASGKSCLTRLLIGVWKPQAGSVRLDGVELSDWSHDEVGPHIGYVPQEIEFFEGTIAENIARLGVVDSDKVIAAATLIGIHDIILSFPSGYDTRLGDSGFALSGGQRQRVALARAFYGSPKYIVMDEPNASLDDLGDNALIAAIRATKAAGTSFVITTHRPRLISIADNLLVLRQGKQVGFGPAMEMMVAVRNLKTPGSPPPGAVQPITATGAAA